MDRLRRRRGDEVLEEWRVPAAQHDPPQASDAESLLDLQARAGNRAVSELVGAHGVDAVRMPVQRDAGDGTQTAAPADDRGGKPRIDTLSIPELKVAIPVQSFQGGRRWPGGTSGGGRGGEKESTAGEVTVTFAAELMNARLWEAMAKGREFGTITITLGPMTITLHGVIISGAQVSGNAASMTLNCSSMEIDPGPQEAPPSSDWGE